MIFSGEMSVDSSACDLAEIPLLFSIKMRSATEVSWLRN